MLRTPSGRSRASHEDGRGAHGLFVDEASALLTRLKALSADSPFILHNQSSRSKPIGHTTLNSVIDRIDIKGTRFVPHGVPSDRVDAAQRTGFRSEVIEKALAHGERNKVRKVYNKAAYAQERSEMLQWWADYLDALERGENVIPCASNS